MARESIALAEKPYCRRGRIALDSDPKKGSGWVMNRAEHVAWSKQRALEYVERGELANAMASMVSDLNKHPETSGHLGCGLGVMLRMGGGLKTEEEMRKWIEGFN